jgi:hypothetical protein
MEVAPLDRHVGSLNSRHRQAAEPCPKSAAISRLPFSENRRIADDKNANGSRTRLAVWRAKVVTRKQVLLPPHPNAIDAAI